MMNFIMISLLILMKLNVAAGSENINKNWRAADELTLSQHDEETLLFGMYPSYSD